MRKRAFSYADAARLMGGGDDQLVRALDTLAGGALLVATAGGSELAISLFDAKSEFTRLSEQLVKGLSDRARGLGRLDQNDRMAAAQAVIVVLAYFEAVREADLPLDLDELRLDRADQTRIVTGAAEGKHLADLAAGLLHAPEAAPSPFWVPQEHPTRLLNRYRTSSLGLLSFLEGSAVWDTWSETDRDRVTKLLLGTVPAVAIRRRETLLRRLAVEFPELAFYLDRADHAATRQAVATGLAALEANLRAVAPLPPDPGTQTRRALALSHAAGLGRAVVASGDVPEFLRLPALRDGYIDPDFRFASAERHNQLHLAEFWAARPVQQNLGGFLAAHFGSPEASVRPLMVLGQPGAGKSVLTQFLAARLPPSDFLVVRVVLRQVPADADVQTQIEEAVRIATGEPTSWPALSRSAGNALRVVILDGFDELLQTTGVGQSAYLRELAAFQEREADQERPVAVVVTSRVSVADRALVPEAGVSVVHLEPFQARQIERWVEIWNDHNAASLESRGLQRLAARAVLAHPDLAEQPLLLLMLALYDCDGNSLQRAGDDLSTPELYERLLDRFARREVEKSGPELTARERDEAVRDELHRLSIAAVAMFNRGRQWVTQGELDDDLRALESENVMQRNDFRSPVTPGARAIGKFFFVHRMQSRQGGDELTAVEFLHATFGEYLVARLVVRELVNNLELLEFAELRGRRTPEPELGLLLDVLAYVPLTIRGTVLDTLGERLDRLGPERREALTQFLLRTFRAVAAGEAGATHTYRPRSQSPAGRQAMQTLNLLLLALCTRKKLLASELLGPVPDVPRHWRGHAMLWSSQCTPEGWGTVLGTVRVDRSVRTDGSRDLQLRRFSARVWLAEPVDPQWFLEGPTENAWAESSVGEMRQVAAFLQDAHVAGLTHSLDWTLHEEDIPVAFSLAGQFLPTGRGEVKSGNRILVDLWLSTALTAAGRSAPSLVDDCRDGLKLIQMLDARARGADEPAIDLVMTQILVNAALLPRDVLEEARELMAPEGLDGGAVHYPFESADRWFAELTRLLDSD